MELHFMAAAFSTITYYLMCLPTIESYGPDTLTIPSGLIGKRLFAGHFDEPFFGPIIAMITFVASFFIQRPASQLRRRTGVTLLVLAMINTFAIGFRIPFRLGIESLLSFEGAFRYVLTAGLSAAGISSIFSDNMKLSEYSK